MKALIIGLVLFAASVCYAEEATTEEPKAVEEAPLDNKALLELAEEIAAITGDKDKTDVEKDNAKASLVGKKFEIKCKLIKAMKLSDDKCQAVFEDESKKNG